MGGEIVDLTADQVNNVSSATTHTHQPTPHLPANDSVGIDMQSTASNFHLPELSSVSSWTSIPGSQIPIYIDLTTMSRPIPDYVGAFRTTQQHVHKRPAQSSPLSERPSQRPRLEAREYAASRASGPIAAPRVTTASSHTHGHAFTPIEYNPSSTANHAADSFRIDAQAQGRETSNTAATSHPRPSLQGTSYGDYAAASPNAASNTDDALGPTVNHSRHGIPYSEAEDQLLFDLRQRGVPWPEIPHYFQGRTLGSLRVHYSTSKKLQSRLEVTKTSILKQARRPKDSRLSNFFKIREPTVATNRSRGTARPFDEAEDQLLYDLRQRGVPFWQMTGLFQGRTEPALRIRYAEKYGNARNSLKDSFSDGEGNLPSGRGRGGSTTTDDEDHLLQPRHALYRRTTGGASKLQHVFDAAGSDSELSDHSDLATDTGYCNANARLLQMSRRRELGIDARRSRYSHTLTINDLTYQSLASTRYIDDASGDIAAVAWAPNGQFFAGGGVVLSDESSMQYNRPRNLLIGDRAGTVRELPEHHIARPIVNVGVNALHSMRETQDPRLFSTVQAVSFSPDSRKLYSVSTDGKLNSYNIEGEHTSSVRLVSSFEHRSPVDLLSVSRDGIVATGARTAGSDSIKLFDSTLSQSPFMLNLRTSVDTKHPSALKWGVAAHQRKYLLAGFTCDKQVQYAEDDTTNILGEACLIVAETGTCIQFGMARNVFDMAWNPRFGNTAYAVAYSRGSQVNEGMHSVVQLFGERSDGKMRCSVELECPAHDINDVLYCPHDDNLVAAGSTDGKVYVWDSRFLKRSQDPVRSLSHGSCLSVLPHTRPRWESDTGIRFLSWGASRTQLYSGGSDGVLKCWNPYLAPSHNHVADIATFSSAIMSGVFNHDYTSLIIGEDSSRMNLLEVGADPSAPPSRFDFLPAAEHSLIIDKDENPDRDKMPDQDDVADNKEKQLFVPASRPSTSDEKPWQSLLDNEEIVFAHCGALPIRQAVQGPKYRPRKPLLTTQEAAQYASAQKFQNSLFHQRNRWKKTKRDLPGPKPAPCRLDCAYLPPAGADDAEIEDSGRSADRIPEELGRRHVGVRAMVRGLLVDCVDCGAKARPAALGHEARCERCGFACFRCGERAWVDAGSAHEVVCGGCRLRWRVGVLGYTLVGGEDGNNEVADLGKRVSPAVGGDELGDEESDDGLGDEEWTEVGDAERAMPGDGKSGEELGDEERERHLDHITLRR